MGEPTPKSELKQERQNIVRLLKLGEQLLKNKILSRTQVLEIRMKQRILGEKFGQLKKQIKEM